jgi:hypothetical protein
VVSSTAPGYPGQYVDSAALTQPVMSANEKPFELMLECKSEAIASGVLPDIRSVQTACPIAIMSESLDEGHENPRFFSFARYASSVASADAIAVLTVRAAPTSTGIVSLVNQRGANI